MRHSILFAVLIISMLWMGFLNAQQQQQPPQQQAKPEWEHWKWLMGDWVGEGGGAPGQGTATFSFAPDLDGRVIVRRNHNVYPAAGSRPGFTHDDLLIVYPGSSSNNTRAIYFDNEGHVIEYEVTVSADSIVFLSTAASTPRFRLTYLPGKDAGGVTIRFEMSPTGKVEEFKTYVEGTARKKAQ